MLHEQPGGQRRRGVPGKVGIPVCSCTIPMVWWSRATEGWGGRGMEPEFGYFRGQTPECRSQRSDNLRHLRNLWMTSPRPPLNPWTTSCLRTPEPILKPRKHERHETNGRRTIQVRFSPFSCLRGQLLRIQGPSPRTDIEATNERHETDWCGTPRFRFTRGSCLRGCQYRN